MSFRFFSRGCALALAGLLAVAGHAEADVVRYDEPSAPKVAALQETPSLQARVEAQQLPPVGERLPAVPLVSVSGPDLSIGKHGGDIRTLVTRDKDVRMLIVYGYARLVGYDEKLAIVADILEWLEVEDGDRKSTRLNSSH